MTNKRNNEEYTLLRQEILQYLEEYQSVRNMMYFVTATILGVNGATVFNTYICLLPLIVILPSYLITRDYWKNVERAATYLQVFYEENADSSFHWESRLYRFAQNYKPTPSAPSSLQVHQFPYIASTILCIILYFISILNKIIDEAVPLAKKIALVAVGGVALLICVVVFLVFHKWKDEKDDFIDIWEQIKAQEKIR